MTPDMTEVQDDLSAPQSQLAPCRVRQLASTGLQAETIRQLTGHGADGSLLPLQLFTETFKNELSLGYAEADRAIAATLFELAASGKSVQATLAWARQRLGWRGESETLPHDTATDADSGWIELQTLMDELASRKAGSSADAQPVDRDLASQPAVARRG